MKKFILITFVLGIVFACNQKPSYIINGTVTDSSELTVFLQQRIGNEFISIDSSKIVDGSFSFKGTVDLVEEYYLSLSQNGRKLFFLENSSIEVKVDSLFEDAEIIGGETQTLFNTYLEKYDRLYDFMLSEYYKAREIEDDNERIAKEAYVDSLYESIQLFQEVFMKENLTSPVAAYILSRIQYGKKYDELNKLFLLLDGSLSGMKTYQMLYKRIEELKLVAIGHKTPDFTQNDVNGNPIVFSDVYSANKFTLIDFWASWCGPCRAENPNVVAAFEKYHSKGFTVFGVSLDKDKESWVKAIEEDNLKWQQVSDLKGWGNEFSKAYAVNSIPANFLVDQNGIIVEQGLRGEDLHSKLGELLNE